VPTKDPASRPDRQPPVRVRSCRLPVHFAPFWSTCRVFLAFARVPFGDRPRSDGRHAAPEMHGAQPASHTRNKFAVHGATPGRGTPKDAAALPPAARGRPVRTKNPQNPRFASKSVVYNSRKSKVGHSGVRDTRGSLTSTQVYGLDLTETFSPTPLTGGVRFVIIYIQQQKLNELKVMSVVQF